MGEPGPLPLPPGYAYGSRLALRNHLGATHNTNFIAYVSL